MTKLYTTAAVIAFAIAATNPVFAAGAKTGFSSTSTSTQGSSGKLANPKNSTSSQGDTTTSTTGPKGQVKQGKTANTTTTTSGPGNSMP